MGRGLPMSARPGPLLRAGSVRLRRNPRAVRSPCLPRARPPLSARCSCSCSRPSLRGPGAGRAKTAAPKRRLGGRRQRAAGSPRSADPVRRDRQARTRGSPDSVSAHPSRIRTRMRHETGTAVRARRRPHPSGARPARTLGRLRPTQTDSDPVAVSRDRSFPGRTWAETGLRPDRSDDNTPGPAAPGSGRREERAGFQCRAHA